MSDEQGLDTQVSTNQTVASDTSGANSVSSNQSTTQTQSTFNPSDYVPKARVEELIHERTKKAAEKARTEALAQAQTNTSQATGMGGMGQQPMTEDRFRQLAAEEFKRQSDSYRQTYEREAYQKRLDDLAQDYMSKISSDPDLVKRENEIGELALLVPYINETSEVSAITKHLLDNGAAFAQLMVLQQQAPERVRRELKKIEAGIKTNSDALNRQYPNDPIQPVTPSINTMDSGAGSIEALKKQPWLRG
jgi:hypothetical protein